MPQPDAEPPARKLLAARGPSLAVVTLALAALVGCQPADAFYRHTNLATGSGGQMGDAARDGEPADADTVIDGAILDQKTTVADAAADSVDLASPTDALPMAGDDASDGDPGDAEVGCGACKIDLLYWCEGTAANTIRATFQVVNGTAAPVPLHEFTIRYWFTEGPGGAQWDFACDNGMVDVPPVGIDHGPDVTGVFKPVVPARPGADTYFEVGFIPRVGDDLMPNVFTQFRTRVFRHDYNTITQTDDYSFNPRDITFAPWSHVALYRNGVLISGVEPPK